MSCAIIKNPESSPRGRRVVIKAMSKGVDFEMLRSKLYQYCMEKPNVTFGTSVKLNAVLWTSGLEPVVFFITHPFP